MNDDYRVTSISDINCEQHLRREAALRKNNGLFFPLQLTAKRRRDWGGERKGDYFVCAPLLLAPSRAIDLLPTQKENKRQSKIYRGK